MQAGAEKLGVIEASYASAIIGVLSPVSSTGLLQHQRPAAIRHSRKESVHGRSRGDGRAQPRTARSTRVNQARCGPSSFCGMVQTQVTAQGCLGSTPEGRRPQIRGWHAGGSLAVSSPTPATPLLSPAKIRELNHAAFASLSYPTDRQVVRNPHVGRPGFLVSMSIHPRTAARRGRHAGLLLTPNCQRRSARSRHT